MDKSDQVKKSASNWYKVPARIEINTDGTSMFTFIELASFSNRRADYLTDDEFKELQENLIENPEAGATIQNTGGFRKLRWAGQSGGKRGGLRIIYYNLSAKTGKLYLATIYSKKDAADLTPDQKKQLKLVASKLK